MIPSVEYRYAALLYKRLNDDSGHFYVCGNCFTNVCYTDWYCRRCGLRLTNKLWAPGAFVWSDDYCDFLEVPDNA